MKKTFTSDQKLNIAVIIGLLGAAALVAIDQFTKWLVVENLTLHVPVQLIKIGEQQVLNLTYYLNDGAAFSMFGGKTAMLICITSLMMGAMVCAMVLKHVRRIPYIVAFSMVIGGGIGNLIDRIFNDGLVVDFIDVRIINFAIFNFADICAVCGGLLLCALVIIDEIKESREKKENTSEGNDTSDMVTDDGNDRDNS